MSSEYLHCYPLNLLSEVWGPNTYYPGLKTCFSITILSSVPCQQNFLKQTGNWIWFSLCWFFLQTPKQLLRALLLAYSCKCPGFSSTRRACTETLKNHSHPIIKFLQCLLWLWSLLRSRNHLPLEYIFWALGHFQKLCLLLIRLHITIITDTYSLSHSLSWVS